MTFQIKIGPPTSKSLWSIKSWTVHRLNKKHPKNSNMCKNNGEPSTNKVIPAMKCPPQPVALTTEGHHSYPCMTVSI